jgi:hypothetical protein
MPALYIKGAHALLTADGGTDGYVTVADATPFWPKAHVWIKSSAADSVEAIITEVVGNFIGLQAVFPANGGARYDRSDMSAFLLTDTPTIDQKPQIVPAELTNLRKI